MDELGHPAKNLSFDPDIVVEENEHAAPADGMTAHLSTTDDGAAVVAKNNGSKKAEHCYAYVLFFKHGSFVGGGVAPFDGGLKPGQSESVDIDSVPSYDLADIYLDAENRID